jgi:hypothetical protein
MDGKERGTRCEEELASTLDAGGRHYAEGSENPTAYEVWLSRKRHMSFLSRCICCCGVLMTAAILCGREPTADMSLYISEPRLPR